MIQANQLADPGDVTLWAMLEGNDARIIGLPRSACPYDWDDNPAHWAWLRGWDKLRRPATQPRLGALVRSGRKGASCKHESVV